MKKSPRHLQNFWLDSETDTTLDCFPCGRSECLPLLYVYMCACGIVVLEELRVDWHTVQWTSVVFICSEHLPLFFRY